MFFKNQRIGKYEILETIGTGGFGSVYLAKDVFIDKMVAIKVPHKQGDDVEKLLQEPRMLAVLNHAHIVTVLTAEQTNGVFYIIMEYVDGNSLERHLRQKGPLPLDQALTWFIHIGEALAYAHRKNIIHRDIRPANILISKDGHLKVGDFGTSRYLLDNPFASTRIGSPPYMAPEHFQGKATYQSDIYSLGVLMYEALTNKLPFYDKNPSKLAKIALVGDATPIADINPEVSDELSRIIARAMHPKQNLRYPNADALVAELKKLRHSFQAFLSEDMSSYSPSEWVPTQRAERAPAQRAERAPAQRAERAPAQRAERAPAQRVAEAPVMREAREEVRPEPRRDKWTPFPSLPTREISSLFCWNCSKPIQKRTQNCPHCSVSLK